MKAIAGFITGAVLAYLVVAFEQWIWNPGQWADVARFIDVMLILFLGVVGVAIINNYSPPNK